MTTQSTRTIAAFLLTTLIVVLGLRGPQPADPVDDPKLGVVVDDGVPF